MKTFLFSFFGAAALMFAVAGCNCCASKSECPFAEDNSCVAAQADDTECSQEEMAKCAKCPNCKGTDGKCCKAK